MIAIVHSIYSQSVNALALNVGSMDNDAGRYCNSASEMFVNLNIPSFDEPLLKFVFSLRSRIQDSGNSLVNGIVKSSVPLFSKLCAWYHVE